MATPTRTFDEAFDALAATAYRVAFRLLGSRPDAEDVAQEALARASVRWRKVEPYAEAWTARVASNLALGLIRRGPPPVERVDSPGSQEADRVADRRALVQAIRTLPKRQREAVTLRYLADLSEADVAHTLGCSVGSVKQHTSRGLAALRVALDTELIPPTGGPDVAAL